MRVERTGAERVFQRIGQEYASRIYAVDIVNSSDAAHLIVWKRDGHARALRAGGRRQALSRPSTRTRTDSSRASASFSAPIAYNTNLVKPEDAPKSYADLLDPKWAGKIVKAHPSYSGTILTATYQTARDIGWDYFEKLAKQRIMQVQSASDPPKKLALGERAIMADGVEYVVFQLKEKGDPVDLIYPTEGTPLIIGPNARLQERAEPERGAAAAELHVLGGMPAVQHRSRRAALGACADQGKAGPHADEGHQADEGRRGGGREARARRSRSATRSSSRSEREESEPMTRRNGFTRRDSC